LFLPSRPSSYRSPGWTPDLHRRVQAQGGRPARSFRALVAQTPPGSRYRRNHLLDRRLQWMLSTKLPSRAIDGNRPQVHRYRSSIIQASSHLVQLEVRFLNHIFHIFACHQVGVHRLEKLSNRQLYSSSNAASSPACTRATTVFNSSSMDPIPSRQRSCFSYVIAQSTPEGCIHTNVNSPDTMIGAVKLASNFRVPAANAALGSSIPLSRSTRLRGVSPRSARIAFSNDSPQRPIDPIRLQTRPCVGT